MLCEEYDEQKVMNQFREEGREEGLKEGLKKGREDGLKEGREDGLKEGRNEGRNEGKLTTLFSLVDDGDISVEKAAKKANMKEDEFVRKMEKFKLEANAAK